jgi:hypothetical protein
VTAQSPLLQGLSDLSVHLWVFIHSGSLFFPFPSYCDPLIPLLCVGTKPKVSSAPWGHLPPPHVNISHHSKQGLAQRLCERELGHTHSSGISQVTLIFRAAVALLLPYNPLNVKSRSVLCLQLEMCKMPQQRWWSTSNRTCGKSRVGAVEVESTLSCWRWPGSFCHGSEKFRSSADVDSLPAVSHKCYSCSCLVFHFLRQRRILLSLLSLSLKTNDHAS